MMQFIQQNYSEPITLEEISKSVNVSKSTALNIFARYLNDTPVNYLISYRLKKAAELLKKQKTKYPSLHRKPALNPMRSAVF